MVSLVRRKSALFSSVVHLTSQQRLHLAQHRIEDETWESLDYPISGLIALTFLDLADGMLGREDSGGLAKLLGELKSLQYLNQEGTKIQDSGMEAIASSLSILTALQVLNLRNNYLSSDGIVAFADPCEIQVPSISETWPQHMRCGSLQGAPSRTLTTFSSPGSRLNVLPNRKQ